ncbi:hypothetical protein SLA2020_152440 [Shorea laevis]
MSSMYQGKRGRGYSMEPRSTGSRVPTRFQIEAGLNPSQNMSPVPGESFRTKRRYGVRRPRSVTPNERTIVTRSMSTNADCMMVLDERKKHVIVLDDEKKKDVIVLDNDEKKDDEAKEEIKGEEKTEAKPLEGPGSGDGVGGLEDWPWTWTYEEEWMWFGKGSGVGCYPHWETMTGVSGLGNLEDSDDDNDTWGFDDIWQLRKIKEIPKP